MKTEKIVLDVMDYLDQHLAEEITIDHVAGKFHFNRYYLMKMFKKVTGLTIIEYVNQKKITASFKDLICTDDKVLKLALKHGFNSLEYYSETFYKVVGISPSQFRKSMTFNPNILLEGDESDMTKLDQVQKDIELLRNIKSAMINTSVELRRVTYTEPKQSNPQDKPKVYVRVMKDKKAA